MKDTFITSDGDTFITSDGDTFKVVSNNGEIVTFKVQTDNQSPLKPGDALRVIIKNVENFNTIRQGTSTNSLTKVKAKKGKNIDIDPVTKKATVTGKNISLTISNYDQLEGLKTSTYQLLDIITILFTESGAKSPTVILPLDEYIKRRGLKDRKEARKQFISDLDVLLKTSLTWDEKEKGKIVPYARINIVDSWMWVNKQKTAIAFTFGQTFYKTLLNYATMPYPTQLQTINNKKNPNSYYLLRKIAEHKNMNFGKKNENIISVETLLAASPFFLSHKEVMSSNRHFTQRIITPFERDMDALEDPLNWHYCHSLNEPLSDEELNNMNYEIFKRLFVFINWKNYPNRITKRKKTPKIHPVD